MKAILFILVSFVSSFSWAQTGFSYCATAKDLCNDSHGIAFSNNLGTVCNNNSTRLFFKFVAANTGVSVLPLSGMPGSPFGYTVYGNIQSSIKIHGPFTVGQNHCDPINSFQSNVLYEASNVVSYPHYTTFPFVQGKIYYIEILANSCAGTVGFQDVQDRILSCTPPPPCEECIPDFQPPPGEYVLSAWVKENDVQNDITSYLNAKISVSDNNGVIGVFSPSGNIIDGWQKIDGLFTIDAPQTLQIELISGASESLFDDIRIFPKDGSTITYVYDPITFRLMAELDERNFATFYEYDEEGKLIRIKKETEKGVMTIQENRENNSLNNGQ